MQVSRGWKSKSEPEPTDMALPFTIQIPVFNETDALRFSAFYFQHLGVPVRYVLDTQHTPTAAEALRSLGHEPVYFSNDRPFIESGYEAFAAASPTDWILRLDCDEVPTDELISAAVEFVTAGHDAVGGFERLQLRWNGEGFDAATNDRFDPVRQRQWRLFDRRRVTFNSHIHTPGIEVPNPWPLRSTALAYHLSWVFLSWEDRLEKAARYDAHGQPARNRANQLFPLEEVTWRALDAPFLQRTFSDWIDMREQV